MRTIRYFRDPRTRLLISRVGSKISAPKIDFQASVDQKDFKEQYPLIEIDIENIRASWYETLIPISNKKIRKVYLLCWINYHRKFWGFKEFKK